MKPDAFKLVDQRCPGIWARPVSVWLPTPEAAETSGLKRRCDVPMRYCDVGQAGPLQCAQDTGVHGRLGMHTVDAGSEWVSVDTGTSLATSAVAQAAHARAVGGSAAAPANLSLARQRGGEQGPTALALVPVS